MSRKAVKIAIDVCALPIVAAALVYFAINAIVRGSLAGIDAIDIFQNDESPSPKLGE
jgi:hypothetical protein